MYYSSTTEYYATTKKIKIMKFGGKWIELKTIILNEKTQNYKGKYCIFL